MAVNFGAGPIFGPFANIVGWSLNLARPSFWLAFQFGRPITRLLSLVALFLWYIDIKGK
jgi:hypothetical protein